MKLETNDDVDEADATNERRMADAAHRGTETILLVEDEPSVRGVASQMLRHLGYVVIAAGDARQALEIVGTRTRPIHLLLIDVVLPDMNGPTLARKIDQIRPGIKSLFISGYPADALVLHGVERGIRLLQKPFSTAALGSALRSALDSPLSHEGGR